MCQVFTVTYIFRLIQLSYVSGFYSYLHFLAHSALLCVRFLQLLTLFGSFSLFRVRFLQLLTFFGSFSSLMGQVFTVTYIFRLIQLSYVSVFYSYLHFLAHSALLWVRFLQLLTFSGSFSSLTGQVFTVTYIFRLIQLSYGSYFYSYLHFSTHSALLCVGFLQLLTFLDSFSSLMDQVFTVTYIFRLVQLSYGSGFYNFLQFPAHSALLSVRFLQLLTFFSSFSFHTDQVFTFIYLSRTDLLSFVSGFYSFLHFSAHSSSLSGQVFTVTYIFGLIQLSFRFFLHFRALITLFCPSS
jgi:hypothetical protein